MSARFSRDLYQETVRKYKDPNTRRMKVAGLYEKFGVREIRFEGKIVGWRVGEDESTFVCFKKRFNSENDAKLVVTMGSVRSFGKHKATEVYHCKNCNGWHATSKGHTAGTRK